MDYLKILLIAAIVLIFIKLIFHLNLKRLFELIINIILGIVVLWLINKFGGTLGIFIPINIITALIVGIIGLPGVIILVLLNLIGLL